MNRVVQTLAVRHQQHWLLFQSNPRSCPSCTTTVVVICTISVHIQSSCSMHVAMLPVSAAIRPRTSLLILLLPQHKFLLLALFVLSQECELRRSHELVVMFLLQFLACAASCTPINLTCFFGILRVFNLHSIDLAHRIIRSIRACPEWLHHAVVCTSLKKSKDSCGQQ